MAAFGCNYLHFVRGHGEDEMLPEDEVGSSSIYFETCPFCDSAIVVSFRKDIILYGGSPILSPPL
eukprot:scaffold10550_cov271-Chaetoceros_neogracile.AAC.47